MLNYERVIFDIFVVVQTITTCSSPVMCQELDELDELDPSRRTMRAVQRSAPLPPLSMFSEAARRMAAAASENCDGTPKSSRPQRSNRSVATKQVISHRLGFVNFVMFQKMGYPAKIAKMTRQNCQDDDKPTLELGCFIFQTHI